MLRADWHWSWRMSLSANRCPLRRDMRYTTRRSVGCGARSDQAATLTYTGGRREVIRHEAGCVRAQRPLSPLSPSRRNAVVRSMRPARCSVPPASGNSGLGGCAWPRPGAPSDGHASIVVCKTKTMPPRVTNTGANRPGAPGNSFTAAPQRDCGPRLHCRRHCAGPQRVPPDEA
jgi:hypothetical protein